VISEGDPSPDFSLQADDGSVVTRDSLKGKKAILFFYPKDDTSGCTKEACAFRDAFPEFGKIDATVLGISPDDIDSHRKFKKKYELPYKLLVDENHRLADAFGGSPTCRAGTGLTTPSIFGGRPRCAATSKRSRISSPLRPTTRFALQLSSSFES